MAFPATITIKTIGVPFMSDGEWVIPFSNIPYDGAVRYDRPKDETYTYIGGNSTNFQYNYGRIMFPPSDGYPGPLPHWATKLESDWPFIQSYLIPMDLNALESNAWYASHFLYLMANVNEPEWFQEELWGSYNPGEETNLLYFKAEPSSALDEFYRATSYTVTSIDSGEYSAVGNVNYPIGTMIYKQYNRTYDWRRREYDPDMVLHIQVGAEEGYFQDGVFYPEQFSVDVHRLTESFMANADGHLFVNRAIESNFSDFDTWLNHYGPSGTIELIAGGFPLPTTPVPMNGAQGVSASASTLEWSIEDSELWGTTEYQIYINDALQGDTGFKTWNIGNGPASPLLPGEQYTWRLDTLDTDTGWLRTGTDMTSWAFGTLRFSPLVPDRPPPYDPDLGWDEPSSTWIPTSRGGGRYRQQLVAVGKDGEIYYGDV